MPYIMEKRGRGGENQTVPDYYLQPSVPQEFVSLSVLHSEVRQAGLKAARKSLQDGGRLTSLSA